MRESEIDSLSRVRSAAQHKVTRVSVPSTRVARELLSKNVLSQGFSPAAFSLNRQPGSRSLLRSVEDGLKEKAKHRNHRPR